MVTENILAEFDDGSVMIYAPLSSVRIANRGPSPVRVKDYERVRRYPPEWWGFVNVYAQVLAVGHLVMTHLGLRSVVRIEHGVNAPLGEAGTGSCL